MIEEKIKDELIQLVEDSELDSMRITDKRKLEKEIVIEKRKTELRKIVVNANLDYTLKLSLFYKIQQNSILSEYELTEEIERKVEF